MCVHVRVSVCVCFTGLVLICDGRLKLNLAFVCRTLQLDRHRVFKPITLSRNVTFTSPRMYASNLILTLSWLSWISGSTTLYRENYSMSITLHSAPNWFRYCSLNVCISFFFCDVSFLENVWPVLGDWWWVVGSIADWCGSFCSASTAWCDICFSSLLDTWLARYFWLVWQNLLTYHRHNPYRRPLNPITRRRGWIPLAWFISCIHMVHDLCHRQYCVLSSSTWFTSTTCMYIL